MKSPLKEMELALLQGGTQTAQPGPGNSRGSLMRAGGAGMLSPAREGPAAVVTWDQPWEH